MLSSVLVCISSLLFFVRCATTPRFESSPNDYPKTLSENLTSNSSLRWISSASLTRMALQLIHSSTGREPLGERPLSSAICLHKEPHFQVFRRTECLVLSSRLIQKLSSASELAAYLALNLSFPVELSSEKRMKFAIGMLYRSGYDPRGMVTLLKSFQTLSPEEEFVSKERINLSLSEARLEIATYPPLRNPVANSREFTEVTQVIREMDSKEMRQL